MCCALTGGTISLLRNGQGFDTHLSSASLEKGDGMRKTFLLLASMALAVVVASEVALAAPIEGTDASEVIFGTPENDVIYGFAGGDFIRSLAGDDEVHGGTQPDKLWGDEPESNNQLDPLPGGEDTLFGESGNDQITGYSSNDTLRGGRGKDNLDGSRGADTLYGGDGDDTINTGQIDGMTNLIPDKAVDHVYCGPGLDLVLYEDDEDVVVDCEGKISY
jgi:Ca2+-binding RTX toxin-like protein